MILQDAVTPLWRFGSTSPKIEMPTMVGCWHPHPKSGFAAETGFRYLDNIWQMLVFKDAIFSMSSDQVLFFFVWASAISSPLGPQLLLAAGPPRWYVIQGVVHRILVKIGDKPPTYYLNTLLETNVSPSSRHFWVDVFPVPRLVGYGLVHWRISFERCVFFLHWGQPTLLGCNLLFATKYI